MATQADVRRIALKLPGVTESRTDFAFGVIVKAKHKGFVWSWKERIDPGKARVPNAKVVAIRTTSVAERDAMVSREPKKFFTEPHYAGFPAVLVRLDGVTSADLRILLEEGRRTLVPEKTKTPAQRKR